MPFSARTQPGTRPDRDAFKLENLTVPTVSPDQVTGLVERIKTFEDAETLLAMLGLDTK